MKIDLDTTSIDPARPPSPLAVSLRRRTATLFTLLTFLWIIFLVDTFLFHSRLVQHGIVPRSISGLPGILFAPFLHASFSHLFSNSLAILFLGGLLLLRSEAAFWTVSILGALATGLGTWVIGRGDAVHAGASGVIFAYFGYLLFAGIFERRIGSLLLSFFVFFLWGGMLWQTLPTHTATGISWEGHLSGLAGGILAAKLLAPKTDQSPQPTLP